MLTASALMGMAVMVVVVVGAQRPMRRNGEDDDLEVCGNEVSIYWRSLRECPAQAVCADKWNTVRDWYNGTRCRDHRIIYNCVCPGNRQCPVDNPEHVLYTNDKQSQYQCEPVCSLEACRTGFRPAQELIRGMRRRSFAYYRTNCRCADHHVPLPSRNRQGRLVRATRFSGIWFNRRERLVHTQYKCVHYIEDDPCA